MAWTFQIGELETARLRLRPLRGSDVDAVFAYASDPEVARYVAFERHTSLGDSREFVADCLKRYSELIVAPWGIELKSGSALIGTIGVTHASESNLRVEVGYAIARQHWNQGYVTEALRAVVPFLFAELPIERVQAFLIPENGASLRVLEKAGFHFEGTLRKIRMFKGELRDLAAYSVLRGDLVVTGQ